MADTLEQQVREAIERHRQELVKLVRRMVTDQLDAELDRLVADEIAVRGNGAADSTVVAPPDPNALRSRSVGSAVSAAPPTSGHGSANGARPPPSPPPMTPETGPEQARPDPSRRTRTRGLGTLLRLDELEEREQRRAMIAAAATETIVDAAGRSWTLRRLPPERPSG